MKTLIFDSSVTGHHLEYLHHYYVGALSHQDEEYVLVVPSDFEDVKRCYIWPEANHISICYLSKEDETLLKEPNFYKLGWNVSRILNRIVRKLEIDRVLLTMLMQFIPFIIFLLPRNVLVRGIMYKIYLYEENKMSKIRLLAEKFRLWLATRSSVIEKIFVLNDFDSVTKLNSIYNTCKFCFLPDPVPEVDMKKVHDMRIILNIPVNNKVYLHFGGLDYRKGTIDILKAIISANREEMKGFTFIFAGKVKQSLHNEFYSLLHEAQAKANILVFDEFCSYEFLNNLCYTCDVILMPYHLTNLSSGLLGYAAVFRKPVIGPKEGLIGLLVTRFKMGATIDVPINKTSLLNLPVSCDEKMLATYAKENSMDAFMTLILK